MPANVGDLGEETQAPKGCDGGQHSVGVWSEKAPDGSSAGGEQA